MRITRTTIPYGSDNLILCHPYSIWVKDKDGKVHNGSLFITVTGETMKYILSKIRKQNFKNLFLELKIWFYHEQNKMYWEKLNNFRFLNQINWILIVCKNFILLIILF